jgi:hypothetical protein
MIELLRKQLAAAIEHAIEVLNTLEGDSDFEEETDHSQSEDDFGFKFEARDANLRVASGDDEPSLGWSLSGAGMGVTDDLEESYR